MKIAVDFDGTIVEHKFPKIGQPVPGAIDWMKRWKAAGAKLILWTMRSGQYLDEAVEFCRQNGVEFDSVNQGIGDRRWTQSPKAYAQVYIDDSAYGCPLEQTSDRPRVDWSKIGPDIYASLKGVPLYFCPDTGAYHVGDEVF